MGLEDNLSNLPARNQSGVHESERRKERQKITSIDKDTVYFVLIFNGESKISSFRFATVLPSFCIPQCGNEMF